MSSPPRLGSAIAESAVVGFVVSSFFVRNIYEPYSVAIVWSSLLVDCRYLRPSMASRKPRSHNMKVDEQELYTDLKKLALERHTRYSWDGKHYGKPSRSMGPQRDHLASSSDVLAPLVKQAPNGYPDFKGMRAVWMRLHRKRGILRGLAHDASDQEILKQAGDAVDIWRTMVGHALGLRLEQLKAIAKQERVGKPGKVKQYETPLQSVLDQFVVDVGTTSSPSTPIDSKTVDTVDSDWEAVSARDDTFPGDDKGGKDDEDGEDLTDDDQVDAPGVLETSPLRRSRSVFANAVRPATTADTEDDEVLIVAMVCRCPDCKAGKGCTKPEEEIPVPCPIRGGQTKKHE